MSEFTRAQLRALMKRADELIAESQRIRERLERVMTQIEKTGSAKEPPAGSSSHKASK